MPSSENDFSHIYASIASQMLNKWFLKLTQQYFWVTRWYLGWCFPRLPCFSDWFSLMGTQSTNLQMLQNIGQHQLFTAQTFVTSLSSDPTSFVGFGSYNNIRLKINISLWSWKWKSWCQSSQEQRQRKVDTGVNKTRLKQCPVRFVFVKLCICICVWRVDQ